MTILTEVERATTLLYYERGWSYQEIVAELLAVRAENLKRDVQREVVSVITHRFSSNVKCTALKEIVEKRAARGDIVEGGRIIKSRSLTERSAYEIAQGRY